MRRILIFVAIILIGITTTLLICAYECFRDTDEDVARVIGADGAAISELPVGVVFVPQTGGGEKAFGDQQLISLLPWLPKWSPFRGLDLEGTSVTDASIAKLINLSTLEELNVSYTAATANGLLLLQHLSKLQLIIVGPNQISADSIRLLEKTMPKTKIRAIRDSWYAPPSQNVMSRLGDSQ